MQHPFFSIITITYNAVQWVEQTILNVLGQSYPNIEYIIIDGGSTDGTVDIIKRYESGITYWVSEPDKGIYFQIQIFGMSRQVFIASTLYSGFIVQVVG